MKSKVHPTYKTKYRVANWPAYNQTLVRRGDVTVWLSSEAIAAWTPRRSGRRGGCLRHSLLIRQPICVRAATRRHCQVNESGTYEGRLIRDQAAVTAVHTVNARARNIR